MAVPMREGRPRWYENTGELLPFDASTEIPRHLSILVTRWPPVPASFYEFKAEELMGLYTGPTSIAYFFFSMQEDLPSTIEGKTPLEWTKAYLECAAELRTEYPPEADQCVPICSSWCGMLSDTLWHPTLMAAVSGDATHLQVIWDVLPAVLTDPDPEAKRLAGGLADEWPTGRASFLHLLRFIGRHVPQEADRAKQAGLDVIEAILRRNPDSEQPWFWFGRYYLMAHGWLSTMPQILLSDPTKERAATLRPWILRCIGLQLPSGNWPAFAQWPHPDGSRRGEGEDHMVQIGHGGPGVVVALLTVKPFYEGFGDEEMVRAIDAAVSRAQKTVWERGLLSKESSVLHGAAGNSQALLDRQQQATFLARSLQEEVDAGVADGTLEQSHGNSGLSKGLAGRVACMLYYRRGLVGRLPTFNDY